MRGGCRDNYCGQQALEPFIPGFKPWVSSINYSPPPTIYGGSHLPPFLTGIQDTLLGAQADRTTRGRGVISRKIEGPAWA